MAEIDHVPHCRCQHMGCNLANRQPPAEYYLRCTSLPPSLRSFRLSALQPSISSSSSSSAIRPSSRLRSWLFNGLPLLLVFCANVCLVFLPRLLSSAHTTQPTQQLTHPPPNPEYPVLPLSCLHQRSITYAAKENLSGLAHRLYGREQPRVGITHRRWIFYKHVFVATFHS